MASAHLERLELPPEPGVVRQARDWLATRISDWSSEGIDTVRLLVSEVLTNAILHTDDPVELTAERSGSEITVAVIDRNPSRPVLKTYGEEAATGRGLHLVAALADEWGVGSEETRKSVWFRVVDGSTTSDAGVAGSDAVEPPSLADWPELDESPAPAPPSAAGGPHLVVRLRELPIDTYLAAEEHHDALLREFVLVLRANDSGVPSKAPRRLIELIANLTKHFGNSNERRRSQVETAKRSGRSTVDVEMLFPAEFQGQLVEVADQLDEVDRFCEHGDLLTPPSSPALREFRRWYTEEVVRQLQGRPSTPWPYG